MDLQSTNIFVCHKKKMSLQNYFVHNGHNVVLSFSEAGVYLTVKNPAAQTAYKGAIVPSETNFSMEQVYRCMCNCFSFKPYHSVDTAVQEDGTLRVQFLVQVEGYLECGFTSVLRQLPLLDSRSNQTAT
jgi:hypothetical protein